MYSTFKFIHLIGVVVLLGNVTATAVWKVMANRDGTPNIVAFAQRLVTFTDWSLTLGGAVLIAVGGYGMAVLGEMDLGMSWLLWGQLMFAVSGLVWLARLVPIQIAQSTLAPHFADDGEARRRYLSLCHRWIAWGVAATVPLVIATWLMVAKP